MGEIRIFLVQQGNEFQLVPYVIPSITLLNVSATPGIVTTRTGSKVDVNAGWPCCGVDWISEMQWETELCLRNAYHSHLLPIVPGKLFCARLTHSSRVFPHKIDRGNPITTFSISNLHIIAAATEVNIFPRPISFATSAPGISVSQSHLLTTNHMAQTWCTTNFVLHRPRIEYFWPGTQSSVDWRIGYALSSLTA